jgi:4-carboxymuconolactone decarboxylase
MTFASRPGGMRPVQGHECTLRRLAIGDDAYLRRVLASEPANVLESRLDPKTHALVRIGALIAVDAPAPSYLEAVEAARASGTPDEEIVGCLLAVLPELGAAPAISAAPKLGLALGYDVAAALEESLPTRPRDLALQRDPAGDERAPAGRRRDRDGPVERGDPVLHVCEPRALHPGADVETGASVPHRERQDITVVAQADRDGRAAVPDRVL